MQYTVDQKRLLWEAGLRAIYENLTTAFLIAFALALGAGHVEVGLIGAIPYFSAMLGEFVGGYLSTKFSRKSISIMLTIPGYALWILIAVTPSFGSLAVIALMILYAIETFLLQLTLPAWISWIAEIIPESRRGHFFSHRNKIMNFIALVTLLVGGWYLDLFPEGKFIGFSILFIIGAVFGLLSVKAYVPIKERNQERISFAFSHFWDISPELKRFIICSVVFYAGVALASPFFSVFVLENLGLSYTAYVASNALTLVAKVLSNPAWGKLSDKYGDKSILVFCSLGISLVPLLYGLTQYTSPWFLIPVTLYTGWIWAGVDLSIFNLFLGYSSSQKRPFETATYNAVTSIPQMVFPIVGGLVADSFSIGGLTGVPLLFAVSIVARLLAALPFAKLHEPRPLKEATLREMFDAVVRVSPIHGLRQSHRWHLVRLFRKKI